MSMRSLSKCTAATIAILAAIAGLASTSLPAQHAADKLPNIILIIADD